MATSKRSSQRREAKETKTVTWYHGGSFETRKLFINDRYVPLTGKERPYGIEFETDCSWYDVYHGSEKGLNAIGALLDEVVFGEFPRDLFKYEKDCSITGAECITQCMTREFVRNHYPEFKNLFDVYLPRFGMLPTDKCGMHVNIGLGNFGSNPARQLDCSRKLYYFINKNYRFCCGLFRRNPSATRYCSRMPYDNARTLNPNDYDSDHSVCFNFGHYYEGNASRIEIRLVGPQKTYASFRNTMECVFHLVSAVKNLTWDDMDNMMAVFAGCNKHVLSRLSLLKDEGLLNDTTYEAIEAISDKETSYL